MMNYVIYQGSNEVIVCTQEDEAIEESTKFRKEGGFDPSTLKKSNLLSEDDVQRIEDAVQRGIEKATAEQSKR